jgi:hypothetical protein
LPRFLPASASIGFGILWDSRASLQVTKVHIGAVLPILGIAVHLRNRLIPLPLSHLHLMVPKCLNNEGNLLLFVLKLEFVEPYQFVDLKLLCNKCTAYMFCAI